MTFIFINKFYRSIKDSVDYKFIIHKRLFITSKLSSTPELESIDFDSRIVKPGNRYWISEADNIRIYSMQTLDRKRFPVTVVIVMNKSSYRCTYHVNDNPENFHLEDNKLTILLMTEDICVETFVDLESMNACFIVDCNYIYETEDPDNMKIDCSKYFIPK